MNAMATIVLSAGLVFAVSGCSEPRENWYDPSKAATEERTEKIKMLQGQGLEEIPAARETDLQSAIKETERGKGVPALEGSDLQDALARPPNSDAR